MSTTDTAALKPCPMCGGVAEIYNPFHLMGKPGQAATYHGGVKCKGCGCQSKATTPPDKAIAAWNRRATTPLTDEQIINIADSYSFTWDEGIIAFARALLAATHAPAMAEPEPGTTEYGSWVNKARNETDMKLSFHRDPFKYLCQFQQELKKLAAASGGEQG